MIIAVVITTVINNIYIICFLSLCCKNVKTSWSQKISLYWFISLLPGILPFLVLLWRRCPINSEHLVKDNTHNVFVFMKHLIVWDCESSYLILFYRCGSRGAERLIGLSRVIHLVIGRARCQFQGSNKSTLYYPGFHDPSFCYV